MIRAFKLMDENSSIEHCEDNGSDNTIQDSKLIKLEP